MVPVDALARSERRIPDPAGRWFTAVIVSVILLSGGVASSLLWAQTKHAGDRSERQTAARISDRLSAEVRVIESSLANANLLVDSSGAVSKDRFDDFAAEIVSASAIQAVAYEPIVTAADRPAFESTNSITIRSAGGGGFVTSPVEASYAPVQWVRPETSATMTLRGFDILSEPVRAAAARAAAVTDRVQFTSPIPSQPNGTTSLFVIRRVMNGSALVGYVSTAVNASDFVASLERLTPTNARIAVRDGGTFLLGSPSPAGSSVTIRVGGRTWTLVVTQPDQRQTSALVALLLTLIAAGGVAEFLRRSRKHTTDLDTASRSVRSVSRLNDRLAACATLDDVIGAVAELGGAPVEAAAARFLVPDAPEMADDVLAIALRTALLSGRPAARSRSDGTESPPGTVVALPVFDDSDSCVAAIGWSWSTEIEVTERLRSTLDVVRVLCQTSFSRVGLLETIRFRSAALYALGQELSVARTVSDLAHAVVRHGPSASGFDAVTIAHLVDDERTLTIYRSLEQVTALPSTYTIKVGGDNDLLARLRAGQHISLSTAEEIDRAGVLRRLVGDRVGGLTLLPLRNSSARLIGVVAFIRVVESAVGTPANLASISDLVAQTLERADLFEQQAKVVLQLQERALAHTPAIQGVEIATRYLPAAREVGVGGDWYSVEQPRDGALLLTVGDVVGHGVGAVVDMVEISGLLAALARTEPELSSVPTRANDLLRDADRVPQRMATAIVMKVDLPQRVVEYVRLGHLPAMLMDAFGTVAILEGGGFPPLGVTATPRASATVRITPGSSLLLYTDGLIERRGESLDVGLARLSAAMTAAAGLEVESAVDAIVHHCVGDHHGFDDLALLLIRLP